MVIIKECSLFLIDDYYTGVDPKQKFGNKKQEPQASTGAGPWVTCPWVSCPWVTFPWVTCPWVTYSIGRLGNWEAADAL